MIKLTFLGDILCDYNIIKHSNRYHNIEDKLDFSTIFAHISHLLDESDYVVANLETPISIDNSDLTDDPFCFNTPIEFAEAVKNCGVDFVTTANNHCLDRGVSGVQSTLKALEQVDLPQCGINTCSKRNYQIIDVSGVKLGIVAYTYGTNAAYNHCYLSWRDRKLINLLQEQEGQIKRLWKKIFRGHLIWLYNKLESVLFPNNADKFAHEKETISFYRKWLMMNTLYRLKREKPDLTIACLHVGGQLNYEPTVFTKRNAAFFVKHGCDLVIANHEHVVHGSHFDNNDHSFSAYALGDCVSGIGVQYKPFGRLAEYSIAVHIYYDELKKQVNTISFSVFKQVEDREKRIEVWPAAEIYDRTNDQSEQERILKTAELFSGVKYKKVEKEFIIPGFGDERERN